MNTLALTALETAYPLSDNKLAVLWFILIGVLWIGFFFLEGFDFGVGMLLPFLSKKDADRRVMVNTIGPHWDGNEVWLLTAGGATFAAFAGWYASLFSSLYLPLFLVLVGLILRGVAFEFRGKQESPTWRRAWDWAACVGSFLPTLVFGVGFANFLKGVVLVASDVSYWEGHVIPVYSGFWSLFHPFCLVGGLLFVALFITHGAIFLSLKTRGDIQAKAKGFASKSVLVTVVLMAAFVIWGNAIYGGTDFVPGKVGLLVTIAWVVGLLAVLALVGAWFFSAKGRDGLAFLCTSVATVTMILMVLLHMFPNLGFNSNALGGISVDLTLVANSHTTLKLMTIFAAIMVPVVLAYQVWTYFVFRRRLSTENIVDDSAPVGAARAI
ncbi:MAG: cytochrome d ubiquinol oxidase subunit II [Propionibacteriaceae bacterium]|jgi:cytochrome d ubiquinol oxidase subunit II|nr:cytochrome d ubiquinol oxidase subunit II [Propionibacteriaceae bacterium]